MIAIQQSERNGKVVAATLVRPDDEIMLITDSGVLVRTRVAEIRELGRATQGVTLIALDDGAKLDRAAADRRERRRPRRGDRRRRRHDIAAERRRRRMRRRAGAALIASLPRRRRHGRGANAPATPTSPAKKELVQRLLRCSRATSRASRAASSSGRRRR